MSKCIEKMRKAATRGIALGLAAALTLSMLTVSAYAKTAKQPKPSLNTKIKTMYYDVFSRKTYNLKIKNLKANQIISTTWKTSNKKAVAISKKKDRSVLLTAKKKGKATITATVKYIPKGMFKISKKRLTCKVTSKSDGASKKATPKPTGVVSPAPTNAVPPVHTALVPVKTPLIDDEAPDVESADITDYKTITVSFTEPVTGTPVVNVYDSEETAVKQESVLAEDGRTMTISCEEALPAGTYKIIINGLSDLAGNEMEKDTSVQVEKEESVLNKFAAKSEHAPAGLSSFNVYYDMLDQYGQQYDAMSVISDGTLTAEAKTTSGMPLSTNINPDEGYITVSGFPSTFAEGKVIEITLTYTAEGQTVCESMLQITMAAASSLENVGFERLYLESDMEITGTDESPEYVLTDTEENNVIHVSARFLDEFGYALDNVNVTYTIDNKDVLAFADTSGINSESYNISDHGVTVKALAGGNAVITAYLSADESISESMTVTVKPASDSGDIQVDRSIQVKEIEEGTNGQPGKARVTVLPEGSGITAEDLDYDVINGEDCIDGKISFVQEEDGIYVNITAKTNGRDNDIQFRVCCDMGTEDESDDIVSDVVTYKSAPLPTPNELIIDDDEIVITAGGETDTSYRILNIYGENITNLLSEQLGFRIDDETLIKNVVVGSDDNIGTLTVQAQLFGGKTYIEFYIDSVFVRVNVEVQEVQKIEQHVGRIEFDEALSERELDLNDADSIIYAPIKVYNQDGEEYENFTKEVISEEGITITVKGAEQGYKSDLDIFWCKGSNESYEEAGFGDNITAVGIRWTKKHDITVKAKAKLPVSFRNSEYPMFEAGEFTVSVVESEKETVKVELNVDKITLYLGLKDTEQLTASVVPDQSIKWISSDEDVVTVRDDGLVRAVGVGDASITAVTVSGEKAECTVNVSELEEKPVPDSSNTIKITYEKDGDEVEVDLKLLDSYLDEERSVLDAFDLLSEMANKLDIGAESSRYIDVNGDGEEDENERIEFKKIADNEALLKVVVEDKERKLDVTWDKKEDSGEVSATVTEDGKKYVITVQPDNENKIIVEKDDEMITVEKTSSGYTIAASNGFGITFGDK